MLVFCQGNAVLSTAFERKYGPSPYGHFRVARGIFVQVCWPRAWFCLFLVSMIFVDPQGQSMDSVGDHATRPAECMDYPCPCLEVCCLSFVLLVVLDHVVSLICVGPYDSCL